MDNMEVKPMDDSPSPTQPANEKSDAADYLEVAIRGERGWRGPAWRWICAGRRSGVASALWADPWLDSARCYRELVAAGRAEAAEAEVQFPAVARAAHLEQCPETTFRLRLLSLAGVPIEEIAERSGTDAVAIETWQRVFFDIADCREKRDWIQIHVCAPEQAAGRGDVAFQFRLALAGGPAVARHFLDVGPPANETDRVRKRRERLELMTERAFSMLLHDSRDAMKFIELAQKLRSDERRLEIEEQKLAHRVLEDARRHERALFVARLRQESTDRRRRQAGGWHPRGPEYPIRQGGGWPGESAACPGAPASDAAPSHVAPSDAAPVDAAPAAAAPVDAATSGVAKQAGQQQDRPLARETMMLATCMAATLAPPVIDGDSAAAPTPVTLPVMQGGARCS